MWTCSSKLPLARLRTVTASSKSRAVSPSMVTMSSARKPRREVAAVAKFLFWNGGGNILRLIERCRRKMMGQMKLANGDLHVNAKIVLASQDLEDAAARVLRRGG